MGTFLLIYSFKELTMMMRVIVVFALLLGLAFCQDQVNLNCKSNKCKFALTFDQDYNFVFKWQVSKEKVVLTSPSIDSFGPIKIDESELPTDDSVLTKDFTTDDFADLGIDCEGSAAVNGNKLYLRTCTNKRLKKINKIEKNKKRKKQCNLWGCDWDNDNKDCSN